MRGSMLVLVLTAVMATALVGCADADQQVDRFRAQAEELTDRAPLLPRRHPGRHRHRVRLTRDRP
jgi:hypothetical protein